MSVTMAGVTNSSTPSPMARLLRHDGSLWQPVGDPLPPFAHIPPDPDRLLAPWAVPREPAPEAGDVLSLGDHAHQLMVRCDADDPLYVELARQTMVLHSYEETAAWLSEIEVWIGRRLDPGRPWPTSVPSGG